MNATTAAEAAALHAGQVIMRHSRLVAAVLSSFLGILIVDFLIHAVLLGPWWHATAVFWRQPDELFRLIPFAYLSFLLDAAGLTWLLVALKGDRPSLRFAITGGTVVGAFIGLTGVLATYSILPLPRSAFLVFPLSSAAAFAAAWAWASLVLTAQRPWRRFALLALAFVLLFVLGVVLQSVRFPARPH